MNDRYRMHCFDGSLDPLGPGRSLFGRTPAQAIAQAAQLWANGTPAAAPGYGIIDTKDGNILWQQQRSTSDTETELCAVIGQN